MRIAHVTDIHVESVPSVFECFNKRALGEVNLHVLGRASHFSGAAARGLVTRVGELAPDVVLCTGDLTAVATEAEFVLAREVLAPLTTRFPFRVIPGNHDVYTGESVGRFARHFGKFSAVTEAWPAVWRHGDMDVVAIDVCHPDWASRGRIDAEQLSKLDERLGSGAGPVWLMVHYPIRDRRGAPYGPWTRACSNAAEIEAVLARHPRVGVVLHGHEHHGYRTSVGSAVSLNPGAGGYAFLPEQGRTAHFNVYTVDSGELRDVERWAWNGSSFEPEVGGAYASGG